MQKNIFIPQVKPSTGLLPEVDLPGKQLEEETVVSSNVDNDHSKSGLSLVVARYAVIFLMALLPIIFLPQNLIPVSFDKSMLAAIFLAICSVIMVTLSLKVGRTRTVMPVSLGIFWILVVVALVSALLSGDANDALSGSLLEQTTFGFGFLLALSLTLPLVLQRSKGATSRALVVFGASALLLMGYSLLRIILGPDFLDFGRFTNAIITPIGTFNDLAIFSALTIIISVVTLIKLPLQRYFQFIIAGLVLLGLSILSVVNFNIIWYPLGFFAFWVFLYLISKHTLFGDPRPTVSVASGVPLALSALVGLVSMLFILVGGPINTMITKALDVSYTEVRPSFLATTDIVKAVWHEDPLLGIGPNRFADAWRLHKDPLVNETIYWETDFQAGYGYVPTMFATTGILGGTLLVLFHLSFLYLGFRMFVRNARHDLYWNFFGSVSFAAACFIWGMSYVYVPNSGLLLIGALFTGFTYAAAGSLLPNMVRTVALASSQQRGFVLMAVTIIVLVAAVGGVFSLGKQYVAQAIYYHPSIDTLSPELFIGRMQQAYGLYPEDKFSVAQVRQHINTLKSMISIVEPTEKDLETFRSTADLAIITVTDALSFDRTDPSNHAMLASVYNTLLLAGVTGAAEKAEFVLKDAIALDPQNPGYHLILALLAEQQGDIVKAREELKVSLALKKNFSDALFLLAQLDIREGNTEAAIKTTQDMVLLEPQNPTRYLQLGLLRAASDDTVGARKDFLEAIALDPDYANARYLLAIEYLKTDERELALEQLKKVKETNPDNQDLIRLIQAAESGDYSGLPSLGLKQPVKDNVQNQEGLNSVGNSSDAANRLISPTNPAQSGLKPESTMVEREESGAIESQNEAITTNSEVASTTPGE